MNEIYKRYIISGLYIAYRPRSKVYYILHHSCGGLISVVIYQKNSILDVVLDDFR